MTGSRISGLEDVLSKAADNDKLRLAFLRWQCRLRQMIMRDNHGKPDDGIMPQVLLAGSVEPIGQVITVLSKGEDYSKIPEMQHMVRKTHDPAQRRSTALTFFSETYYQKAQEFSDTLTSSFLPGSQGAQFLLESGRCRLVFEMYSQRYELACMIRALAQDHFLYQSTYWHNLLFNPGLPEDVIVLGFEPDWGACVADPSPV